MATSPIYSWPEPDNTDLVKNGALAIRTLGNAIDTTMGTMVPKTIIDAKGDLIAGTAADTASRLAVGANGTVLTADSAEATGLKWAAAGGSGGGMTLLNTGGTTLTGTSVSITSIPSTYNELRIYVVNFKPTNNGNGFAIRFNQDANANRHANTTTFSPGSIAFNATQAFVAADQNNSVATGLISLTIPYYANATTWKIVQGASVVTDPTTSTNAGFFNWAGLYNQTTAISSLEFRSQSDFLSGTVYVYGVK